MNTIPLFSIAIAYSIGIVLGKYIHIGLGWIYGICLITVCLSIISSKGKNYFLLLTAIVIGCLFYTMDSQLLPANHISHLINYKGTIIGSIVDYPQIYSNRTQFTLEAESVGGIKVQGKVQVGLAWMDNRFEYGDKILLVGKLQQPFSLKNPNGFDYQQYLAHQKIRVVCWIQGDDQIKRIGKGKINPIMAFSVMIKNRAVKSIYQLLPQPQSSFLDGVILGNRTSLPKNIQKWFADTGTLHILAVSGMNVALVVITFFFFFRLFGINKRLAYLLNIPVVIIFCLVTGCVPSVMRASLMAIIFLVSRNLLERDIDIYHVIGLAALICLVPCPQMLFDISFQLSFLAVLGIIYLTPFISEKLMLFMPKWLALIIATTLGAQLATTPLLSCCFHKMSLISVASNAIIVPLVGLITPLGLMSFGLNEISYKLACLITYPNYLLITFLLICVEFFASVPYACIPVASPSPMDIAIYYLSLITIRHTNKIGWRNAGLICLVMLNLFLCEQIIDSKDKHGITSTFFDIKKGSVAYLEFENNKGLLINIDTKKGDMEQVVLPFLQVKGVKTIDVVIGDTGTLDKEVKIGLRFEGNIPSGKITGCGDAHIFINPMGIQIDHDGVRLLFPIKDGYQIEPSDKRIILNVPTTKIARTLENKADAKIMVISRGCKWQGDNDPHILMIKERGVIIITTDGKDIIPVPSGR
ncbi:MAG: ComEC/Rec2 family competence protein [Candidatus Desantisbacteria bacterium]